MNTRARLPLAIALCAVLALGSSGCVYLQDRGYDFLDVTGIKFAAGRGTKVGIDLGFGVVGPVYEGFGLDFARIVTPPGVMIGYHDLFKFGYEGRSTGLWRDRGIELVGYVDRDLQALRGNEFIFERVDEYNDIYKGVPERAVTVPLDYPDYRYHYIGDIQVAFVPLLFGLEFDASFFQLVDFTLGIFGIDIAYDDYRNRYATESEGGAAAPGTGGASAGAGGRSSGGNP